MCFHWTKPWSTSELTFVIFRVHFRQWASDFSNCRDSAHFCFNIRRLFITIICSGVLNYYLSHTPSWRAKSKIIFAGSVGNETVKSWKSHQTILFIQRSDNGWIADSNHLQTIKGNLTEQRRTNSQLEVIQSEEIHITCTISNGKEGRPKTFLTHLYKTSVFFAVSLLSWEWGLCICLALKTSLVCWLRWTSSFYASTRISCVLLLLGVGTTRPLVKLDTLLACDFKTEQASQSSLPSLTLSLSW
jgi:hypothetical protein